MTDEWGGQWTIFGPSTMAGILFGEMGGNLLLVRGQKDTLYRTTGSCLELPDLEAAHN